MHPYALFVYYLCFVHFFLQTPVDDELNKIENEISDFFPVIMFEKVISKMRLFLDSDVSHSLISNWCLLAHVLWSVLSAI